jgi:hypothetical protein
MKGKVVTQKYPPGLYHVIVTDVRAGVDSKGKELIIVHYENLPDSPRPGDKWKERVKSPSVVFLKALGQPCKYGESWDTEQWRNEEMWIDVKYTPDDAQWPRYSHHRENPKPPSGPVVSEPAPGQEVAEEEIPF